MKAAFFISACAALVSLSVSAQTVSISRDWVHLGDVAEVMGEARDRPIAAAPPVGQRLPLSAEFIEMQAMAAGVQLDLPEGSTIWVSREGALPQATPAQSEPPKPALPDAVDGLIPVLNVTLRRGEAITPEMISLEEPDPRRRIQGLIRLPELLDNTEATRTIKAGQPLSLRDVKPLSVIRKGDPVTLVYQTGLLKLSVHAKALGDAAEGETIRVVNLQSNRAMNAIASGPGEARIGGPQL